MKVLIVWGMPITEQNAQTTCLLEKVDNLNRAGNETIYFSPNIPLRLWKSGLNIFILALYQIPAFFYLFWICIKFKPKIIQSSSPLVLNSLLLSKILRIPHSVEAHGIIYEDATMLNASPLMIHIMKICEYVSYNLSEKIISNAPGTKEDIAKEFKINKDKIAVLPNGANIDLFKPMNVLKSNLDLDENCSYICFVGNLAPWQGIEDLIKSAHLVLEKIPNVKFLIIGDGIMKEDLINTLNDHIKDSFIFTGSIMYEDVPKYINISEICVAPFVKWKDKKMSPLKIFEYMACGKPVITTDIEGSGDIIKEYNAGLTIDPEDHGQFATAMIELMENENKRKMMGRNGRNVVLNEYSWEKIALKMEKIYKSLN